MNRTGDSGGSAVKAIIVDDHTVMREITVPGVEFVGRFACVEDLLDHDVKADVVALDLQLADSASSSRSLQGVGAVRAVSAHYRVCIHTGEQRRHVLALCLHAGASGIVHKSDSLEVLHDSLKTVAAGGSVITRALEGLAEVCSERDRIPMLTKRQKEVLALRARGRSFPQIAGELFISKDTAKDHMQAVNRQLTNYLQTLTPSDLARELGVLPGDLDAVE